MRFTHTDNPIGPTQARFRSNKKGKARRHEKQKFKKRVETKEKQEMMTAVSEAQLEDSSNIMENLILRSNKYRRLKLTLFDAPHDWMIVSAREDSDGTIYREGEYKQTLPTPMSPAVKAAARLANHLLVIVSPLWRGWKGG